MKVLHINSVYGHSSTGRIIADIHHELLAQKEKSLVLYGRKSAFGQNSKMSMDMGTELISSPFETMMHVGLGVFLDKHGLYSRKNTERFIMRIKSFSPDIIHLHNLHGFYLNYEMLFEFLKGYSSKVVWTLHDCWSFTGYCSHYDYNQCSGWLSGCTKCRFKNEYPYRFLSNSKNNYKLKEKMFTSMPITLVVPSQWLASQVKQSFLSAQQLCIIRNNVDFERFINHPNSLREKYHLEDKQILLAVSNIWNKQKGLDEYKKLASKLSSHQILVMIGLTASQMKAMPENILGLERTDSIEELVDWYSTSDAFINLSLQDTSPMVNLEALACDLPVITYRTGGCTEAILEAGYGVDKYDLDAILNIVNSKPKKVKIQRKNKDMTQAYLDLYQEVYHD